MNDEMNKQSNEVARDSGTVHEGVGISCNIDVRSPDILPYKSQGNHGYAKGGGEKVTTDFRFVDIDEDRKVMVGLQTGRADGRTCLHHKIFQRHEDGKVTELEFGLTKKACLALVSLYHDFELFNLTHNQ